MQAVHQASRVFKTRDDFVLMNAMLGAVQPGRRVPLRPPLAQKGGKA
jgi:hypothetical protein